MTGKKINEMFPYDILLYSAINTLSIHNKGGFSLAADVNGHRDLQPNIMGDGL